MRENINNISEIILERYVLGELPESRMSELSDLISSNPDLKQKIDNIKKSNEEILKKYPFEMVSPGIKNRVITEKKQDKSKSKNKYFLIPAFAAVTAAVLFFILPLLNNSTNNDISTDATRIKGVEANIFIYRKTDSNVELLGDGSTAKKNDLLQIAYSVSGKELYGAIISVDGRGTVTLHYPANGSSSKIKTGSKVILQNSYELDDAPSFEKFFFFISGSEIETDKIIAGAKILASDPKRILDKKIVETGNPDIQPDKFKETSLTIFKKDVIQK